MIDRYTKVILTLAVANLILGLAGCANEQTQNSIKPLLNSSSEDNGSKPRISIKPNKSSNNDETIQIIERDGVIYYE